MNKTIYVIHERDLEDGETDVIGVASSPEKADELIEEYYKDFKEISYTDIRDSTLEWTKVIEVKFSCGSTGRYELTLQWFNIDKL